MNSFTLTPPAYIAAQGDGRFAVVLAGRVRAGLTRAEAKALAPRTPVLMAVALELARRDYRRRGLARWHLIVETDAANPSVITFRLRGARFRRLVQALRDVGKL